MALTWKDITGWTPGPLDTAEANLRTARSTLTELADELATMGTPSNWTGSAATAANGKLKTVSQDLKDLVAEVSAAFKACGDAGDGVRGVEQAVDAAVQFASTHQFTITDDGKVLDLTPQVCSIDDTPADIAAR